MGEDRVLEDVSSLNYLLKEKARLSERLWKVQTAIELTRKREAADSELRAFRSAESV